MAINRGVNGGGGQRKVVPSYLIAIAATRRGHKTQARGHRKGTKSSFSMVL